jgi:hypothetical protein
MPPSTAACAWLRILPSLPGKRPAPLLSLSQRTASSSSQQAATGFLNVEPAARDDDEPVLITAHLPHRLRRGESINQIKLPVALNDALTECFERDIRAETKATKQAVKEGRLASVQDKPPTVLDFAAFRMDRSFAACSRVLHEVVCRLPGYAPTSVLDVGAQMGSGSWAAHAVWSEGGGGVGDDGYDDEYEYDEGGEEEEAAEAAEEAAAARRACVYTAVEPNSRMRAAGARVSEAAQPHGPPITWHAALPTEHAHAPEHPSATKANASSATAGTSSATAGTMDSSTHSPHQHGTHQHSLHQHSLVISQYALSTLSSAATRSPASGSSREPTELHTLLSVLWRHVAEGGVLALVDSASDDGASQMQQARTFLESRLDNARVLAPFPHAGLGATSIFGGGGGGSGAAEPVSLVAYKRSFSKGAALPLTQRLLESSAAQVHAQGLDPTPSPSPLTTPCCHVAGTRPGPRPDTLALPPHHPVLPRGRYTPRASTRHGAGRSGATAPKPSPI